MTTDRRKGKQQKTSGTGEITGVRTPVALYGLKLESPIALGIVSLAWGFDKDGMYASNNQLAGVFRVDRRSIIRQIGQLEADGHIEVKRVGGRRRIWVSGTVRALLAGDGPVTSDDSGSDRPVTSASDRPVTKVVTDLSPPSRRNRKNKEGILRPNSDAFRLAELLFDSIRGWKANFKKPSLDKWAVHTDRMLRLDHRTPEQIKAVIKWCQQDDFWQSNILSTEKLRKQFDQLEAKMGRTSKAPAKGDGYEVGPGGCLISMPEPVMPPKSLLERTGVKL